MLPVIPHSLRGAHGLSLVYLNSSNARSFHCLIQEQAELLNSSNDVADDDVSTRLLRHIAHERRAEARLILHGSEVLATITFVDCLTGHGHHIYLEDIVTKAEQRGRGIGTFTMVALAQEAVRRGAEGMVWECAQGNSVAQRFYDGLGAGRRTDRYTWRRLDARHRPADRSPYGIRHIREPRPLARLLAATGSAELGRFMGWLERPWPSDKVLAVAVCDPQGQAQALALAYRSYSTFRTANGLHIDTLFAMPQNIERVEGLIGDIENFQRRRGWTGHLDVTVTAAQAGWLEPLLIRLGFTPLSYGNETMIVRHLDKGGLHALANSLSPIMVEAASRPVRRSYGRGWQP
jgi:ribosomal protein S18 acetylase RimI-like enzyme